MNDHPAPTHHVAVIGAGPAGLFAARTLAQSGVHVTLFNRDIKPGGLAEYGIYPDKETMKDGLRKQFVRIMADPNIEYYGNVRVGMQGDLSFDTLRGLGFDALLVTVGAQGTKWLGLPGEDLHGVYHAKDLVYHYNQLPPYTGMAFDLGRRVALIGAGNVMIDVAHWAVRALKVDEVIAVVRRGPADVKFTQHEFEAIAHNLDLAAFDAEMERCTPIMHAVGQDVQAARDFILKPLNKAFAPVSDTRFGFDFLASPTRMLGANGALTSLAVEETTLVQQGEETKSRNTGVTRVLDVDSVIFCIGDRVDDTFGLPLDKWGDFAKNPAPAFPIEGISYEAWDPATGQAIPGVFLAGWAREASHGLVGEARKDGTHGANAVLAALAAQPPKPYTVPNGRFNSLHDRLAALGHPVITTAHWARLDEIERQIAIERGLPSFKFGTNEEMLAALGFSGDPMLA